MLHISIPKRNIMLQPRRHLPSTQSLQAFEAVARLGSFTQAAEELALTQSAVSRQVAALEGQLGVALLERGPRQVNSTPEGAIYAEAARNALDILQAAARDVRHRDTPGQLTLAILPTFGTRWLIPRIPRFLRRHPEVTLHFRTQIGDFDMGRQRVDAALHAGAPDWPGTDATLLFEDRVQPCAAPGLAAAGTLADIARLPRLAIASRPDEWQGWAAAHELAPLPAPEMVFEHLAAMAQACAAGLGVALLPPFLFRPELARGELVALAPDWANGGGYWLMTPARARPNAATLAFRDWLMTEVTREEGYA